MDASRIEPALALWPDAAGCSLRLVNHSENHTFMVERDGAPQFCLRVHRIGYQSRASINSELAWISALRQDTGLPVPAPIPGRDGIVLQTIEGLTGEPRFAVLFPFVPGHEPQPDDELRPLFQTLGVYAARLHQHAMSWTPPAGFERQVWSAAQILDADGLWGDWRKGPDVDAESRLVLDRLDSALRARLDRFGAGPDRFGLIHADMRLGNLLVDPAQVTLIDFDDCGFCWFAYDFAASISFHETLPSMPGLRAAWLEGYQSVRPLAGEHIEIIDTMVMLRRMALLAWIGSHAETGLAQSHAAGFAQGTVDLAERYLSGGLWS